MLNLCVELLLLCRPHPYKYWLIITYFDLFVNVLGGCFRYKRAEIYKKISNSDKAIHYQQALRGQKLGNRTLLCSATA